MEKSRVRNIPFFCVVLLFISPINLFAGEVTGITSDGLSDSVTITGESVTYTMTVWALNISGVVHDDGFDGATFYIKMRCDSSFDVLDLLPVWGLMPNTGSDPPTTITYSVTDTNGDGVIIIGPIFLPRCQVSIFVASSDTETDLNFSVVGTLGKE